MSVWEKPAQEPLRCFVTAVQVVQPDVDRLKSVVRFQQDHGRGDIGLKGEYIVPDGTKFKVGDVIWATVVSQL